MVVRLKACPDTSRNALARNRRALARDRGMPPGLRGLGNTTMSTALLKFKPPNQTLKELPLDLSVLLAAVEVSPEPMGVFENGELIYGYLCFGNFSAWTDGRHAYVPDAND